MNGQHLVSLEFFVNGDAVSAAVPAQRTLLEMLRYDLGLTGSKQGCDKGDCGACTVLLDGRPVLACISLALRADGATIQTVEGLADAGRLDPLQRAFIKHGAAQCGFCTPGMLISAKALLRENNTPSMAQIQSALSGNLCRCTGYTKIFEAVREAAQELAQRDGGGNQHAAG